MSNIVHKRIGIHELSFMKYSCIAYKIGWYANVLDLKHPPKLFEYEGLNREYLDKWKIGHKERTIYCHKIECNTEKSRYEVIPNYIFVLYEVCPKCGRQLLTDNKSGIFQCTNNTNLCGFTFDISVNMPYKLKKVYMQVYPEIKKNRFKKYLGDKLIGLYKIMSNGTAIAFIILLFIACLFIIYSL